LICSTRPLRQLRTDFVVAPSSRATSPTSTRASWSATNLAAIVGSSSALWSSWRIRSRSAAPVVTGSANADMAG
jgi:hypothetical protein